MTKKMAGHERALDVCAFLHRNRLVNDQWVTVGEYARFAQLSKSPYLIKLFRDLVTDSILDIQQEDYRATIRYTFSLNYDAIEKNFPHVKQAMIERVGAWQESIGL